MKIDKETVARMSELARIRLSDAEISRLEAEFGEIFKQFSSISELGSGDEQLFYVSGGNGKLRTDIGAAKGANRKEADRIAGQFTKKDGRLLVAPKSLD
jgi:aspartyl/glutamyl-tRNA(Asn/Gln) amidotransferase C subunit